MKDKIQKLIAEIIGDGFTVEITPVASGNVSSDFGAGVTTYLSVYTDSDGFQAIYVNGKLEVHDDSTCGPDVVTANDVALIADGRLVRMRSAVLGKSLDEWPENESELKDMIDGYQSGFDAGATVGAPHQDGLALRSQWNNEQGCFEVFFIENENAWVPKPFEWVVLPDGKVRRCIDHEFINGGKYYCFEGTNTSWDSARLKPWKPRCGDWVKINKPPSGEDIAVARWYWTAGLEHLDGETHQVTRISSGVNEGYQVQEIDGSGMWLSLGWLEPAEASADHIPDANEMVNSSEASNSSTSKPGYFDDVEGVWVDEPNPFDGRKIEPVKEPEYREPTYADLANGPIEVEVCDDKTYETNWKKRMLYAVLPKCCAFPFFVANTSDQLYTNSYRHARIKVC